MTNYFSRVLITVLTHISFVLCYRCRGNDWPEMCLFARPQTNADATFMCSCGGDADGRTRTHHSKVINCSARA